MSQQDNLNSDINAIIYANMNDNMNDNMNANMEDEIDDTFTSANYRQASATDHISSCGHIDDVTPSAIEYAKDHQISLNEAVKIQLDNKGLDSNEILWDRIILEEEDIKVGSKFICKDIQIVTNSKRTNGIFNDTYIGTKSNKCVNYRNKQNNFACHSGDKDTTYGLRHTIKFGKIEKEDIAYVFSASWLYGSTKHISVLTETAPVMEFRITNNDNSLKKYVIPQNFKTDGSFTCCAGAKITQINTHDIHDAQNTKMYHVDVISVFCGGFADNYKISIDDVEKYYSDKQVHAPTLLDAEMMDDTPSNIYNTPSTACNTPSNAFDMLDIDDIDDTDDIVSSAVYVPDIASDADLQDYYNVRSPSS